jgi:two-component system, OmpR family, phosphate regulon sensor histidine kinase PhoR
MSSLVVPETSLFELVVGAESSALALQTSAITFKALLSSLIDVLVEQELPSLVWAKLPRGDAWQAEFDRYADLPAAPQGIFLFKNQREEMSEENTLAEEKAGVSLADRLNAHIVTTALQGKIASSPASPILVPAESPLRREYFLLIWSTQFCGLLVANRSKPNPETIEEEGADRKQFLMTLFSLDPVVIRQAIEQLQVMSPQSGDWKSAIATIQPPKGNTLLSQLLVKQVQRQEELWQRANHHRRQAEGSNLLQLHNEELLNTIRLKDEFLHTVGQELRTPLTNMKTALTLLNSPNLKPPQRQRYMDLLVKECDRQGSLIASLLDLVSLDQMAEEAKIQAIQIMDVIPAVVSTYQPVAEEKGVRLAYTVAEKLPPIACLNTWLKQIVINLLHNGIKFTPRGGQVWVRAKQQGDYIQLEFKDTGIGLAQSEIPKIFDRFYRVRQAMTEDSGGAGLGLSIVQQLLLHCGGSVTVKSRVGEGSTFYVLLPIHRDTTKNES